MLNAPAVQNGFSLVELMTAVTVGLIALSAIVTVYGASAHHATTQLAHADLRQQLYGLTELIASDLRRHGYWAFDPVVMAPADNPFEQPENRVRSGTLNSEPQASCVLFSYDLDGDGKVGKGQCGQVGCIAGSDDDNVEQFGFRLSRGRVQARFGGKELDCNNGHWQSVTTPGVVIETLVFTLHSTCLNLTEPETPCTPQSPALVSRAVDFVLKGRLLTDKALPLTLSRWVDLRNAQLLSPQQ